MRHRCGRVGDRPRRRLRPVRRAVAAIRDEIEMRRPAGEQLGAHPFEPLELGLRTVELVDARADHRLPARQPLQLQVRSVRVDDRRRVARGRTEPRDDDRILRGVEPRREQRRAIARLHVAPDARAVLIEQDEDRLRDRRQGLALGRTELARPDVHHPERAERVTVGRSQRDAGEEPHRVGSVDQRVVGEARVGARILHLEDVLRQDRVRAEGHVARGRLARDPDRRLQPAAVAVDEPDRRDRRIAQLRCEARERVERLLRRRVEDRRTR